MKRFTAGLFVGLLIGFLATTTLAFAAQPIRLIVNGKEVPCDPPPQIIDGRTFVPVRFVAEALGMKVEWDGSTNSVVITSAPIETTDNQAAPIEQNNLEGANTTMTKPNLTGWISLRDLAIKGVTLKSTPNGVILTKGEQSVPFNLPEMHEGEQITVSGIRVWRIGSRTYLNLDDLANLGLAP